MSWTVGGGCANLEYVLLVEEEDDGGVHEVLVVADLPEEPQGLHHAVLPSATSLTSPVLIETATHRRFVFEEDLVILGHRHAEDDRVHVLATSTSW